MMHSRSAIGVVGVVLALIVGVSAQGTTTGVAGQSFAWDQAAPDLASAQTYTYKHYDDGATTATTFTTVTCTGTASPFQCAAPIPAYTPGAHSVTITASNVAGESPRSAAFPFTFVVTPAGPANVRIK